MAENPPQKSLAILLVEDHEDTAMAIGTFLSIMGHSVKTADTVETAVKNVIDHRFDLIISDVGLPDGNGVSLIHGIRRFCNTPAIALTGYTGADDVDRCMRAGFDMHLAKPISPEHLEVAIGSLLSGNL